MQFIIIQLLGFIGWIWYLLSYWNKNINKVILFQIICCIFYAVHYFLLGAYTGLIIMIFDAIRDIIYYKTDIDKKYFIYSLPLYIIMGTLSYNSLISILPILASVNDGYNLAYKDKTPVIGAIITTILWIFYDFYVKSYISVITCIIMLISNLIILFKEKNML